MKSEFRSHAPRRGALPVDVGSKSAIGTVRCNLVVGAVCRHILTDGAVLLALNMAGAYFLTSRCQAQLVACNPAGLL